MTTISNSPKMFGAYISNISSSISFGRDSSTCHLTLVEDPNTCISLPEVGTACYVKINEFYFGGVFQRWSYKESTSGRTYDIILETPSKMLDGLQIILDEFEGTQFNGNEFSLDANIFLPSSNENFTTQVGNIYNPFGHEENYAFGGYFGRSDVNSAGFPATRLLELIEIISEVL